MCKINAYKQIVVEGIDKELWKDGKLVLSPCKAKKLLAALGVALITQTPSRQETRELLRN